MQYLATLERPRADSVDAAMEHALEYINSLSVKVDTVYVYRLVRTVRARVTVEAIESEDA